MIENKLALLMATNPVLRKYLDGLEYWIILAESAFLPTKNTSVLRLRKLGRLISSIPIEELSMSEKAKADLDQLVTYEKVGGLTYANVGKLLVDGGIFQKFHSTERGNAE